MITQTQLKPFILCNLYASPLSSDPMPEQPTFTTSLDYGFDFDEGELESELPTLPPANTAHLPVPFIAAEEFDSLYKWFIS